MAQPTRITVHQGSRVLEVEFGADEAFRLPFEYLRTHSPSAEVQGHGKGNHVLVPGKRGVGITGLEPVGNYGILIHFDDGHDTGIFAWATLHELGVNQGANWQTYLERLDSAGLSRDA